jgi:hypothetical protein
MIWLATIIAFFCGFAFDAVWVACIQAVTSKRPIIAANLSAILYFFTIVSTVLIVEKCVIAVAAYVVGGWLGTYVIVRRK